MKGFMHTLLYNISELVTGTKAIDDEQVSQVCTCKASLYTTVQINHHIDVHTHHRTYWGTGVSLLRYPQPQQTCAGPTRWVSQ